MRVDDAHTFERRQKSVYRRAQSTGMTAIKLSARLTRGTIMPSALTANERVLGAGISFSVYYNQVGASKKEAARGARRWGKLAVDIMLRVIVSNWPEKSELRLM